MCTQGRTSSCRETTRRHHRRQARPIHRRATVSRKTQQARQWAERISRRATVSRQLQVRQARHTRRSRQALAGRCSV